MYKFCFNAVVEQRGWKELENKELVKTLAQENVPIEMFEKYTGHEIKLPTKPTIKTKKQAKSPSTAISRCELISANSGFSHLNVLNREEQRMEEIRELPRNLRWRALAMYGY